MTISVTPFLNGYFLDNGKHCLNIIPADDGRFVISDPYSLNTVSSIHTNIDDAMQTAITEIDNRRNTSL